VSSMLRTATTHKRYNSIEILTVGGNNISDPIEIKEAIQRFYQNLYKESEEWSPDLQLIPHV